MYGLCAVLPNLDGLHTTQKSVAISGQDGGGDEIGSYSTHIPDSEYVTNHVTDCSLIKDAADK